jgi:acyl-CoA thioesterase-2
MTEALDSLLNILDLEVIEENIFRGFSPPIERQRVFGGQVCAQALMAAGRTVSTGLVHSLHAYFLRPGDPNIPILYEVDRIRDGRSFATRRVVAIQHGKAIFNMSTSFHVEESGLEHEIEMPEVPEPETLQTLRQRLEPWADQLGDFLKRPLPIDQRFIGELPWNKEGGPREPRQQLWLRADGELSDDQLLHSCILAYASDMTLFDSILLPHKIRWDDPRFMGASIDHCMWFHKRFRIDQWLLFDQHSPAAFGARGLAMGSIFTREKQIVCSVAQEGLVRIKKDIPPAISPGEI